MQHQFIPAYAGAIIAITVFGGGLGGLLGSVLASHANEQIVWMLKGKMELRLGSEQQVCGPGDVVVIPGSTEHEAWFRENTEVIDFFAPPREDFLLGGKPTYIRERLRLLARYCPGVARVP